MTLVKADLGTKRACPSCSARFYDLQKRPIECPKCAFTFEPEALYKQRRPRQPEAEKSTGERARVQGEERQETEETEAEEVDEASADEAAVLGTGDEDEEDLVVVEDEETETTGMTVVDPVEQNTEIEGIEEEEIAEEDVEDPTLLEDVGEEEDDVSGIIDADIEKDER